MYAVSGWQLVETLHNYYPEVFGNLSPVETLILYYKQQGATEEKARALAAARLGVGDLYVGGSRFRVVTELVAQNAQLDLLTGTATRSGGITDVRAAAGSGIGFLMFKGRAARLLTSDKFYSSTMGKLDDLARLFGPEIFQQILNGEVDNPLVKKILRDLRRNIGNRATRAIIGYLAQRGSFNQRDLTTWMLSKSGQKALGLTSITDVLTNSNLLRTIFFNTAKQAGLQADRYKNSAAGLQQFIKDLSQNGLDWAAIKVSSTARKAYAKLREMYQAAVRGDYHVLYKLAEEAGLNVTPETIEEFRRKLLRDARRLGVHRMKVESHADTMEAVGAQAGNELREAAKILMKAGSRLSGLGRVKRIRR